MDGVLRKIRDEDCQEKLDDPWQSADRRFSEANKALRAFKKKVELLRAEDPVAEIVDMFAFDPNMPDAQQRKEVITDFVLSNMSVFQQSHQSLPHASDARLQAVTVLTQPMADEALHQALEGLRGTPFGRVRAIRLAPME